MESTKKLTDEEIVKALKCCTVDDVTDCENCPLLRESCDIIRKYALDLINRLQKENTELQKQLDELKNAYNDLLETCRNCDTTQAVKNTAKEIFEKVFETLCCFTTQGKSKEYAEGFIDCLEEVDKRLQTLAKERYGVEVD